MRDLINNDGIFSSSSEGDDDPLSISFAQILFAQIYALVLMVIPWANDTSHKGVEVNRDRRPFEEKIGAKLSDYFFRRVYRMKRESFYRLHDLLKPRMFEKIFPKSGGTRDIDSNRYLFDNSFDFFS